MYMTVALFFIVVHGLDGREVTVSANEITSLHGRVPGKSNALLTDGVNCMIHLSDGNSVPAVETCTEVRARIIEAQGGQQ